jgi:hypothetical protein
MIGSTRRSLRTPIWLSICPISTARSPTSSCGEYVAREWCGLEWRAIYSHIMDGNSKRVMLFRADDAEIRGLHGLEGFAPIDAFSPDEAVTLILQRLARNEDKRRDFYLEGGLAPAKPGDFQMAVTKLPKKHDHGVFEGRDKVLADLDVLWADALADKARRARIVSLFAIGGAGKTTVASRWSQALLAREGHGGVERYFDWSFYSQGTRSEGNIAGAQTAADATLFVAAALKFFGDPALADSPAPAWDKGARLAALVARHRTLLILDGLEPLQHPPGPQQGELKDDALRALFAGLQGAARGLCLITTREPIADLAATRDTTTPEWRLDHLTDDAGARVLKRHGVTGPDAEVRRASVEVKGHALTLALMGVTCASPSTHPTSPGATAFISPRPTPRPKTATPSASSPPTSAGSRPQAVSSRPPSSGCSGSSTGRPRPTASLPCAPPRPSPDSPTRSSASGNGNGPPPSNASATPTSSRPPSGYP